MSNRGNMYRGLIHSRYQDILKRLQGGSIYGLPVDETDMEMLVVAAYFAGQADVQKEHAGRLQLPLHDRP